MCKFGYVKERWTGNYIKCLNVFSREPLPLPLQNCTKNINVESLKNNFVVTPEIPRILIKVCPCTLETLATFVLLRLCVLLSSLLAIVAKTIVYCSIETFTLYKRHLTPSSKKTKRLAAFNLDQNSSISSLKALELRYLFD